MAWKIESERKEEEIEFVPVTQSHFSHVRSHICEVCVSVCARGCVCASCMCAFMRACVRTRAIHVCYTHTHQFVCGGSIKMCVNTSESNLPTGSSGVEFDI